MTNKKQGELDESAMFEIESALSGRDELASRIQQEFGDDPAVRAALLGGAALEVVNSPVKVIGFTVNSNANFLDLLENGDLPHPELNADMFPNIEDGGLVAEGNIETCMGGHPDVEGLFSDVCALRGDDGILYVDSFLFWGHEGRVQLVKKGDKLVVEQI